MPTLTFSAATSSTGSAFRAFSGVYTFTINGIPENATVNQITFSCAEGAFTRYTNDSSVGTTESVNAKYQMFYSIGSSSSYQPSTSGSTPNTLAVGNSNCYSITDTKIITLTGSSAIPTTVKWTVNSDYMSKFSNGKTIYIYFARTSLVASGTGRTMLQYNTVNNKKGHLICTIDYTLPTSSLQTPTSFTVTQTSAGSLNYTFSWNEATGGTGPYYYSPYCDGSQLTGYNTSTSYSGTVTSYGEHIFKVKVYDVGGGIIQDSNEYTYNFTQAAQQLQAPTITSITQTPANSLNYTVTWSAATGGTGSKTYLLICDGSGVGGLTSGLQASGSVSAYGEHTFKVLVIDDVGTTAYSGEVKHVFTAAPVVTELQAPEGLEVIRDSDNSLSYTFRWEPAEGGSGTKYYTPRCDNENIATKITGTSCSGEVSSYDWHMFNVIVEDDNESKMSDPIYADFRKTIVPTLNPPSNLKITHTDGSSQFTLTWNAAEASGGSGIVTYNIEKLVNGEWEYLDFSNGLNLTGTEYSGTIPDWGEQTLAVCAMYDDLIERASITYNFKYVAATKIAPEITNIDYSPGDTQFYITWSAAYDSSFSGTFQYYVRNRSTGTTIVQGLTATSAWVRVPGYDIEYQFDVYATYANGSLYSTKIFRYTFDSIPPITLEAPGAPTITQSNAQATFSASWTRAVASDGGTNISYSVYCGDSQIGASTTALSLSNLPIPNYNTNNDFYIKASYSGVNISSPITAARFSAPSITTPIVSITPTEGSNVKVSWTEAKLAYTTGDITYKLYCKKNSKETSSAQIHYGDIVGSLEKDIPEAWLSTKGSDGDIFYFQVDAVAINLSHIANNNASLTTSSGFSPGFTFKIGNSVGYYANGAWQECTVYYYDGSEWVECIPYYYDNGWQEINTKIE